MRNRLFSECSHAKSLKRHKLPIRNRLFHLMTSRGAHAVLCWAKKKKKGKPCPNSAVPSTNYSVIDVLHIVNTSNAKYLIWNCILPRFKVPADYLRGGWCSPKGQVHLQALVLHFKRMKEIINKTRISKWIRNLLFYWFFQVPRTVKFHNGLLPLW